MSGTDCTCIDCEVDRARNAEQYITRFADGLYYVRALGLTGTKDRQEATRFGPTHIKIFGKHLTPELVTE